MPATSIKHAEIHRHGYPSPQKRRTNAVECSLGQNSTLVQCRLTSARGLYIKIPHFKTTLSCLWFDEILFSTECKRCEPVRSGLNWICLFSVFTKSSVSGLTAGADSWSTNGEFDRLRAAESTVSGRSAVTVESTVTSVEPSNSVDGGERGSGDWPRSESCIRKKQRKKFYLQAWAANNAAH